MLNNLRILVYSNNPISTSGSNGRTIRNLLLKFPKSCVHNFFIHGENLSFDSCESFYCVSDNDVLHPIRSKKRNHILNYTASEPNNTSSVTKRKRSAFVSLIRNLIWKLGFWKTKEYKKWVLDYKPDVVLIQAGYSPFLCDEARKIATQQRSKLVVFNTEAYCFFDWDFLGMRKHKTLFSEMFRHLMCKSIKKATLDAALTVYLTDELQETYQLKFGNHNSAVIYNSSEQSKVKWNYESKKVIYAGNFLNDRVSSLITIAKVLNEINETYTIHVYSTITPELIEKTKIFRNIILHGFIPYDTVIKELKEAFLLIHFESFTEIASKNAKYAFSTKIADYLSLNVPFLLYSPKNVTVSNYLISNNCAMVASSEDELRVHLGGLISNKEYAVEYLKNAMQIVNANHLSEYNYLNSIL